MGIYAVSPRGELSRRSISYIEELRPHEGSERLHDRTGQVLTT